jgi:type I restriction enzyme S subunit
MKRYDNYKDSEIQWIGKIPKHWNRIRIKNLVKIKITDGPHETPEWMPEGIPFISAEAIKGNQIDLNYKRGNISIEQHLEYCKKSKVLKGDILFCKSGSTTGKSAIVEIDDEFGIWSPLAIIRADKNKINNKFLFHSIQSSLFRNQVETAWTFGTQPNIGMGALENLWISVPSIQEQTFIANYLDQKTTQIDNLITKKEQFITLLQEERTAVINQAVTKGLDPKIKMKDSGIEWLGEIPEHWGVKKLKNLSKITRGAILRPVDEPSYFDENGEWTYLNISDATKCDKYLNYGKLRLSELGSTKSARVEPNNLIITASATIGKPFINKIPVCVHDGFIPITDLEVDIDFLYYYFKNPQLFNGLGKSNTQKNIYLEDVKNLLIAVPSAKEQKEIANKIEQEILRIETIITKTQQEIELLKEYKTALINEVVTGKVDVRDAILN